MGGVQDVLILLSFLLEVAVLFYLEMKAWKTLYTPLVFLMAPYTIVLLISIAISGNFGFVEFYYPSILLWSVGLLVFAIPSFSLAYLLQKNNLPLNSTIKETSMPLLVTLVAFFVILLFLLHFRAMSGGVASIGTHDFGDEFSGKGLWGHLRQLSLPILIMAIYYVNRKNKWLWFIIIPLFLVGLLYQVLGWIVIPCFAGIALRLYTGRTKLKLSLLLYVVLAAAILFFGSYALAIVLAGDGELDNDFLAFIFRHFFHYLTSGTLGLSMDMQNGFPDTGSFEIVIAQLVNIGKAITGDSEMLNTLNPLFYNTGVGGTNVRTVLGTIFINSGYPVFVIFVFVLSCSVYMLKLATIRFNNIFVYVAYFFECGLLFMGWFDSYFSSLSVFEIPILSLVLLLLCRVFSPKRPLKLSFENAIEKT